MEPLKIPIPSKSPGYMSNTNHDKILHSRNVIRSLDQDMREEKSRNVEKRPHQSNYFSKIIENRGATPPFVKKKEHLKSSGHFNDNNSKYSSTHTGEFIY